MGLMGDIAKTGSELIEQREGILGAGRNVIEDMKVTTGTGAPDNGGAFGTGAEQLGEAGDTLKSAFPDDSWTSSGSVAYSARNTEQLSRTAAMLEADRAVAAVLARESDQICTTRQNLDGQSDWLADMSPVTAAIAGIPYVGKASQTATEIAMVAKALGVSTDQILTMGQNVEVNAAELRNAVAKYADIARDAGPSTEPRETDCGASAPAQPRRDESAQPDPAAGAAVPVERPEATQQAAMGATPEVTAGTAIGSILGPLGGILGGITQAASQALQAAVATAAQAAQGATQAVGQAQPSSAGLDTLADKADTAGDDEREKSENDDKSPKDEKNHETAATATADKTEERGQNGMLDTGDVVTDAAGPTDKGAAKTLPPDLASGEFSGGDGRAGARAEVEQDEAQLSVPAAVRLGAALPGSTAVTRT